MFGYAGSSVTSNLTFYVVHIGNEKMQTILQDERDKRFFVISDPVDAVEAINLCINSGYDYISDEMEEYAPLWAFVAEKYPKQPPTVWERTGIKPLTVEELGITVEPMRVRGETLYKASGQWREFWVHARLYVTAELAKAEVLNLMNEKVERFLESLLDREEV